jgi:hypothetical protein
LSEVVERGCSDRGSVALFHRHPSDDPVCHDAIQHRSLADRHLETRQCVAGGMAARDKFEDLRACRPTIHRQDDGPGHIAERLLSLQDRLLR